MRIAIASSCKFYEAARVAVGKLTNAGFDVHHPNFIYDETSLSVDYDRKALLTHSFLNGLSSCKVLYVINTGGYVGLSVSLEIGYATALDIPVWATEQPTEYAIAAVVDGRIMDVDSFTYTASVLYVGFGDRHER